MWSPDEPWLYDMQVRLTSGGKPADGVTSYFGMRKSEVKKDEAGIQRLFLNGKVLFQIGPLDQGWWPDGLYTAATDKALRTTWKSPANWASTWPASTSRSNRPAGTITATNWA